MSAHLTWNATSEGVAFERGRDADAITFPVDPTGPDAGDPALALLEELWGREWVSTGFGKAVLPWRHLLELSADERRLLALPPVSTSFSGSLRSRGWLGPDFSMSLQLELQTSAGRLPVLAEERTGLVVSTGEGDVVLPDGLGRVALAVDAPIPKAKADQAVRVGEIQQLANAVDVSMDGFLTNEEYVIPAGLGVEVEGKSADEIHLRVVPEGVDEKSFAKLRRPDRPTKSSYTQHVDGGRRRRLVFTEDQKAAVESVRRSRVLKGADVPRFLDNPAAFLPDLVDLDRFSPRVRGLIPQRYQSQPYLSVSRSRDRGWFDVTPEIELLGGGLEGDDGGPGGSEKAAGDDTGQIAPSADDERGAEAPGPPDITPDQYRDLCKQVIETGEAEQRFGDNWIHIDPERARKFVESFDQLEGDGGRYQIAETRVGMILDVISNLEELEYDEGAPEFAVDPDVPDYPIPSSLEATLRAHQETGYNWLRYLHEKQLGGLLADDMGLGKTVQVIAFMAHLHEQGRLGPSLIVVPLSLMSNWRREISRFAPGITMIHEHHGPGRKKDPRHLGMFDVVLTTYDTLRRDQLVMAEVDWVLAVGDEAQNVKNPSAMVTAAIKALKASLRIAVTGTPVENGLSELWCLMDWVQAGRLGSQKEFREEFERPIVDAGEGTEARAQASANLQTRLVPHYVRRRKEDVLDDLPPKHIERHLVPMDGELKRIYGQLQAQMRRGDTIPIAALQKLIQACSHPALLEPAGDTPTALLARSPKLRITLDLLAQVAEAREKAVIFTRYMQMQQILVAVIQDRFGRIPRIINGQVAGGNRQAIVDRFNEQPGFAVMILGPDAAGVGLNITGANHAIHYTRLWNPAKENQATDRIHRIGQTRPVTVHYPIVEGDGFKSVEEHIDDLLSEKLSLAQDALIPTDVLEVRQGLQARLSDGAGGAAYA